MHALREADLVIAIGSSMRELSTNNWSPDLLSRKLMQLGTAAPDLAAAPLAGTHLLGDLQETIGAVARHAWSLPSRPWLSSAYETPAVRDYVDQGRLLPPDVMGGLAQAMPPDSRLYADAGNSFAWAIHFAPVDERLTRLHTALGFGAMGWGIGAAVGAALANQGSGVRVVCMTGDGAWMMSGLELTVAVEHRLPITFVVLNDSALGMVRHGQRLGGAAQIANGLPTVDFAAMARAAGATALCVQTPEQLEALVGAEHWTVDGPVVLEVLIDPEFPPPMATRVKSLATA